MPCARLRKVRSSSLGITIAPFASFRNPPVVNGIGAPSSVPTPSIDTLYPFSLSIAFLARVSLTPSVINSTFPFFSPACFNNNPAFFKAISTRLPWLGINEVLSTDNCDAIVSVSSVNGVTIKASPA